MTPGERKELEEIAAHLSREMAGTFSPESVRACVLDSYEKLAATATVTTFLVAQAERFAQQRLQALARANGLASGGKPEVLFVCVHNAGRSQMAALLMERLAEGRVIVRSAGSAPADRLNPAVIEALEELGLDPGRAFPKPLTDEAVRAADVVITMGCGDACPLYPGKRYLDWELEDPAGKSLATARRIRDEIEERVRALLAELLPAPASA